MLPVQEIVLCSNLSLAGDCALFKALDLQQARSSYAECAADIVCYSDRSAPQSRCSNRLNGATPVDSLQANLTNQTGKAVMNHSFLDRWWRIPTSEPNSWMQCRLNHPPHCTSIRHRVVNGLHAGSAFAQVVAHPECRAKQLEAILPHVLALVGVFVHCRQGRNARFPPEVEQAGSLRVRCIAACTMLVDIGHRWHNLTHS